MIDNGESKKGWIDEVTPGLGEVKISDQHIKGRRFKAKKEILDKATRLLGEYVIFTSAIENVGGMRLVHLTSLDAVDSVDKVAA